MPKVFVFASVLFLLGLQACRQAETVSNDLSASEQESHFWTAEESDTAFREGLVGATSAEALTPLVFDTTGHLLTVSESNAGLQNGDADWQTYFTDLSTFREVMVDLVAAGNQLEKRLTDATEENAVQLPANETATVFIYVYDPHERR